MSLKCAICWNILKGVHDHLGETMNDRDNQQKITEVEKAWLAGLIEGDGAIGMGFHSNFVVNRPKGFAVKPCISLTNQDARLIEKFSELVLAICDKNVRICEVLGRYENSRPSMSANLVGMESVARVLREIGQYLVGDKAAKARLLLKFIDSRLSRQRTQRGNPPYNLDELTVIKDFYELVRRKGGKRNPEIGEILNDYMRTASNEAMI